MLEHGLFHGFRDAVGVIVQDCGQAGQVHVGPAIARDEIENFAGQRAAGDEQKPLGRGRGRGQVQTFAGQVIVIGQVHHVPP